ncbi:tetratricopeptide repeat protein [uncultured Methanobacterium sp.]|uniref:tetratricopeptide repeat protein n=1 Tax=uncultured Methanobacterium sp. TaxID=176306 RepID=UPI002AA7FA1B|nr:tetratricopeptide repeat protein [uncultured Methanobacterium sp.]
MVQSSRTFRIFVSSTFSDLKEERSALQEKVFPRLRELCMEHGCRFQAIDLRWGVSEEASLDQQTMKICLEEIDRCQKVTPKPNFIVLLGDKYGWHPVPYEIPTSEFEEIYKLTNEEDKALLDMWFWRDDNAVPPVYDLQPRTGEYEDYDAWMEVENRLNYILRSAVLQMDLGEKDRLKYFASATEQEIVQGALEVPDAEDHVHCFFRELSNVPCEKSVRDFIDLTADGAFDKEASNQIKKLKDRLTNALPGNVHNYNADWNDEGVSIEHLDVLCDDIYDSLSKVILDEVGQFEEIDPLDKEIQDHLDFGMERFRYFQGRVEILEDIGDYLKNRQEEPLTIHGVSGSGKTALMAYAADKARKEYPESKVISRYIGATATSSDIRSLLESLCHQISDIYNADYEGIPTEYQKLVDELPVRLSLATLEKPLIIFLDALDQLSDCENARGLAWLPTYQPENVHLIISSIPGESLDTLRKKFPSENLIELGVMQPGEGEKLLDLWLNDASRTLEEHQKEEVLGKFLIKGLPLYLKLAFEEARRWKSYTNTDDVTLREDIPQLIQDTFQRLSSESQHGEVMVSKSLCYLAASRYGLSEDEILDVLSLDETLLSDFKRRSPRSPDVDRLPVVVWSRLYFDLEPYLTERSMNEASFINFYHRQFTEVITQEYLSRDLKKTYNLHLADYFNSQILNERKVDELPWQLDQAKAWDQLKSSVCNLEMFMEMMAETKKYELMGYWHHIGDHYNMEDEYKKSLQKYEKETRKENLPEYYNQVATFLQLNAYYKGAEPLFRRALEISENVLDSDHPDTATYLLNLAGLLYDKGNWGRAEKLYNRTYENTRDSISYNLLNITILNNLGNIKQDKGDLNAAEKLYKEAHEKSLECTGIYSLSTLASLNNLAVLQKDKGNYRYAEAYYKQALKINKRIYGSKHLYYAISLNNLAKIENIKGDVVASEKLSNKALKLSEKLVGPKHPYLVPILNNLADLQIEKGDSEAAVELYKIALNIRENVLGKGHIKTAMSMDHLAIQYIREGNLNEAKNLLNNALKITENVYGVENPNYATVLYHISLLEMAKGNLDSAEKFCKESLTINENFYSYENIKSADILQRLGEICRAKNDLENSELFYRRALKIREKYLGSDHIDTVESLDLLAVLLTYKGDLDEAESFLKRALKVRKEYFGYNHPKTAQILNNLGGIFCAKKDLDGAESFYNSALTIRKEFLGFYNINTAITLDGLAFVFEKKGKLDRAVQLYRQVLKIREKCLGHNNRATAQTLNKLAMLLMNNGNLNEAEPLFWQLLNIRENFLKSDPPETSKILNILGLILYAKGDIDGAEPLFRRALDINEDFFGLNHPNTSVIRSNLNKLLQDKNNHKTGKY